MTPEEFIRVVDSIALRPAIYFGNRDGHLREFGAFVLGADFAAGPLPSGSMLPSEFIDLVCSRLSDCDGQHPSWQARIENCSDSPADAWRKFTSLWSEYRGGSIPDPVVRNKL